MINIAEAINPSMIVDVKLKNQPASIIPGAITYISTSIKPVHSEWFWYYYLPEVYYSEWRSYVVAPQ